MSKPRVWFGCDWSGNLYVHVWACVHGVGFVRQVSDMRFKVLVGVKKCGIE